MDSPAHTSHPNSIGTDRQERPRRHTLLSRSVALKFGVLASILLAVILAAAGFIEGAGPRTLRISHEKLKFSTVQRGAFHELIPLHAQVVPRETLYLDAVDGGRVNKILVEPGQMVKEGQPLIMLTNTNLALQVVQQESQINQAISQLQQNEISLEQNKLSNDRALADIDFHLARLARSAARQESLAAGGATPLENRDLVTDELAHYKRLRSIQSESGQRQSELRSRLLPEIHHQVSVLRRNLDIVHAKLDGLIIRAPAAGRVTSLDLKIGENRSPGQRLAEITPEAGMRLSASIDESYIAHVHVGQLGTVTLDKSSMPVTVSRISPQVRQGHFNVDLDFKDRSPSGLVAGVSLHGHLEGRDDTPTMVLAAGSGVESAGNQSVFVVAADNKSAQRRRIQIGRRNSEQLEILGGLSVGDRVVTSEQFELPKADLLIMTE